MVRDKVGRHRWSRGLINFVIYSDVTIFASEHFDAVTEHVMVSCAFRRSQPMGKALNK
jgi:hypothetical protein